MLLPRLALAGAVVATGLGAGAATAAEHPVTTEIVVEFVDGATAAERAAALEAMGADLVGTVGEDFAVVEVVGPAPSDPGSDAVADVDPVTVLTASTTPNDPLFGSQWHLRAVQAEAAWDVATGAGVVVAVIDSGVATAAPDLAGVPFVAGRDWVDGGVPDDQNGHGTHVTGTIAQRTGNGIGVAGLAHGASIMPLRVLDAAGAGTDYDVAAAIDHAVANGADVVNLSLGGPTASTVLRDAVARAIAQGVVVVAAAGNRGGAVEYPAALPGVVAVAAVDAASQRASFSNHGPEIDIAAPGTAVVQQTFTSPGAWCYCAFSGTSMAAPHVSATAALLLSKGTLPAHVVPRLVATARDVGAPGRDDATGAGLVQAADALGATATAPVPTTTAPAPAPAPAPVVGPAPISPAPEAEEPPATVDGGVQDIDDACPTASVPRARFGDVDPALVHARAIDCVAWLGIASGVDAGSFAPAAAVTRGQMATFLARLLERAGVALPVSAPDAFDDDDGTTHEATTNRLAAAGIVRGTGAGAFNPGAPVSRAAMATFLVAVHDLVAGTDLPASADGFADDEGNVHEASIDRLAAAGIATGTTGTTFSPAAAVTRAQLATFLARVLDAVIDAGDVAAP